MRCPGHSNNRAAGGFLPTPATSKLASKAASWPFRGALLPRISDLVFKMPGLMIAAELAQRRFVQLKQNLAQLFGCRIASCETLPVNLTERLDQGVAVLVADFAVVVAMTIVETGLAHAALHDACERQ